eukprot:11502805-Alexandrium_andersonii.AAC.1
MSGNYRHPGISLPRIAQNCPKPDNAGLCGIMRDCAALGAIGRLRPIAPKAAESRIIPHSLALC